MVIFFCTVGLKAKIRQKTKYYLLAKTEFTYFLEPYQISFQHTFSNEQIELSCSRERSIDDMSNMQTVYLSTELLVKLISSQDKVVAIIL